MSIALSLLGLSVLVGLWPILGYPLVLRRWSQTIYDAPETDEHAPLTLIIPCRNEAAVIEQKLTESIDQLGQRQWEIIVVDDGSTDNTTLLAKKVAEKCPSIKVMTTPAEGKTAAVNRGLAAATYQIIVISDANARLGKSAIAQLIRWFHDSRVGMVRGRYEPIVKQITAMSLGAQAYQALEHEHYVAESAHGVLHVSGGALQAFRKDLVSISQRTMTEDWDITLDIRSQGKHIVYEPKAVAQKQVTASVSDFLRQNIRLVYGSIQTEKKYLALLNVWKYGKLSIAFWSGKPSQISAPWLLIASTGASLWLWQVDHLVLGLYFLVALIGIGLFAGACMIINHRQVRLKGKLFLTIEYITIGILAMFVAWGKYFLTGGKNWNGWSPIASVRASSPFSNHHA